MGLEVKCWMVNHFKRIQHLFLLLYATKCWTKNLFWNKFHPTPSIMIFFSSFMKCWTKSARLNGSNISPNTAYFACWMKCWIRKKRYHVHLICFGIYFYDIQVSNQRIFLSYVFLFYKQIHTNVCEDT